MSGNEKKKESRIRKLESIEKISNKNQRKMGDSNNKEKIAKTTVEKLKAYLQSKKPALNFIKPAAKTAAERQREYRRRKKQKQMYEQNKENPTSVLISSKPRAKTSAERNKAFRERKKQQKIDEQNKVNPKSVERTGNFDEIEVIPGQETLNAHRNLARTSHRIQHRNVNNINFDEIQAVPSQETLSAPRNSERTPYGIKKHINVNDVVRKNIDLRNATFPVNKAKSYRHIRVKRRQFPLKSACTMTVHKSPGGTYDDIVYTYKKGHLQSLVYVALPRVTSPRGLFIIPANKKKVFYHGRRENDSMEETRTEFDRLSTVRLQMCDQIFLDKINSGEMTIFSFNCQSLNAYKRDLCGNAINQSDALLLSKTWLDNDKHIEIDNFICIVKYKRPGVGADGVGIYKNKHKIQHVSTYHEDIYARNANFIANQSSSVGELCSAECKMHNGQTVIMVSVYISPGKSIQDIEDFIHFVLLPYTEGGAKLLKKNYHEIPMIIAGDFNVNFADKKSLSLIDFFRNALNLEIANNTNIGTTRHGTKIDVVFSRFIHNLSTSIYVSHFSTHKPIVTVIKNNASINEIDK